MLVPVVLSGGAGTRLWPVSREGHPKPFMLLPDGESLLRKTYERTRRLGVQSILTVTNREYFFLSRDEFDKARLSGTRAQYLLEPEGRNTAAAVAAAALWVRATHGEAATMLISAADHLVTDLDAYAAAVGLAEAAAQDGFLVTFGIKPNRPETGFGYIETDGVGEVAPVKQFVEKPDRATAEHFVQRGFLWNSGMFCFTAGHILHELAEHAPEVLGATAVCWEKMAADSPADFAELPAQLFSKVPSVSIDVAVMEKSRRVKVVRSDFGWSDIGSWEAVSRLVDADAAGNRASGDTVIIDSRNNFVHAEDRVVATLGVENLMVVDTPDALLVAAKDRAQDVKKVVEALKQRDHQTFRFHKTVSRPWGTYTVLEEGPRFKIKRIVVKPGATLSLQMHLHRSEHWVVVKGVAKVTNNDQETIVYTNESTYIPAGNRHRLENPGKLELVLIEVQSGEYVGEDDIVRFEDKYGRA
jgi:mannose-1-phosphate guanylyltransferase / mannose-6-phosphate isomerase